MKKKFSFLLVLAVLVMGLSACGSSKSDTTSETKATKAPKATETAEATKEPESKTTDTKGKHHAKIKVKDYGTIEVELDGDTAPITVANFIKLVNEKFYDGLTFHRIMSGFMIQGGDPLGNGTGGSDETIKGEFSSNGVENNISHKRGVISMARSSDPDSASSQFFIMHQDSTYLDGEYAAFGKVTKGMKVVTTEVDEIGYPYAVEFELCPDSAPNIDAILFKGPHSEFVSNWQNTGKFAFRRDGYEFVFHSYRLPAGQWTKIRIEGDAKGTSLFVDGQLQERLEGRVSEHYNEVHKRKDRIWYQETLIFPLKQLGDARMGFKGKVRNLICIPL